MAIGSIIGKTGRGLVVAGALVGAVATVALPTPAHAISDGAAVGLGVGAFALGSALGATARPYGYGYSPYGGYYAPQATYYYPPATTYYPSYYGPYYRGWGY